MKIVQRMGPPRSWPGRLGRRGVIAVSAAAVLVVALVGYLLVGGSDAEEPAGRDTTATDGGADGSGEAGADKGAKDRTGSQNPRNMGQTFGLGPVMGKWRHNEKGTGPWVLTVDRSGALHSDESGVDEQLGQIVPTSGRTYELMIQDPRAEGTAVYRARLSKDGGTLSLGIGTTKVRRFAKVG